MADPLAAYAPTIDAAAQEWGHDPNFLRALIMQESGGDPKAVSKAGAYGLTGMMPQTGTAMGVTDPTDTDQQIFAGAKYLAQGREAEGTPEGSLLYYHGGPDWRKAYGPESAGYVPAVAARYTALTKGAGNDNAKPAASAVPSDDDFLKLAAPPAPAASGVPSDEDFLNSTGAIPPTAATAFRPETAETRRIGDLMIPGPPTSTPPTAQSAPGPNVPGVSGPPSGLDTGEVAQAARQGYEGGAMVTPAGVALADRAHLGFIPRGINVLSGALGGAYEGAKDIGAQAVNSLAPGAGRDFAQAADLAAPFVGQGPRLPMASVNRLAAGSAGADAALLRTMPPRFVGEHFPGELTPADTVAAPLPQSFLDSPTAPGFSGQPNKLAAATTIKTGDKTVELPPRADATAVPAPSSLNPNVAVNRLAAGATPDAGPQSVGAAASRDMSHPSVIDMTPAQVQAYRSTAEGQKLLEPQQPGIADTKAYVPGVSASTAEIEQTVNAAREAKAANVAYPEVSQQAKEQAAANNESRGQFYSNTAGSDVSLMNLKDQRAAEAKAGYSAAFANKSNADVTPIASHIQDLLDQPRNRQNTELKAYVQPLLDRLQNADGTPKIVDPEELYGFREAVNKMTSSASKRKDPGLEHVTTELNNIVKVTDPQIEAAAPGYRAYMDNYAAKSRQIDEQQVLQDAEPKLYAGSQMTYNKVQTFMKNVVDARQSPGLNPYKSITDDTMQRLWNLRDDLRRSASAQELARTPGSDTTQTMLDLAKRGAAVTGKIAVHGVANHLFPVLGSLGVNAADAAIGNRLAARAQRKGIAQGLSNLNPNRLQAPEP